MRFVHAVGISIMLLGAAGTALADIVRVIEGSGSRIAAVYRENGTEVAREYFTGGKLVQVEGRIPDGTVRQYGPDDKTVIGEWQYEGGRKHGMVKKFYANGAVRAVTPYRAGRKDGISREYSGRGKLLREESWRGGALEGSVRVFDSEGKLFADLSYRNNLRDGVTKIFYDNGVLGEETAYKNGRLLSRTAYSSAGKTVLNKTYQQP